MPFLKKITTAIIVITVVAVIAMSTSCSARVKTENDTNKTSGADQTTVSKSDNSVSESSDTSSSGDITKSSDDTIIKNNNAQFTALEVMAADFNYSNIVLVNNYGEFVNKITNDRFNNFAPELSFDGNTIAFYSDRDGDYDIYTVNTDGTGLKNITNNEAGDYMPKWSIDGKKICYYSDEAVNTDVYIMNSDGTGKIRLVKNDAENSGSIWSADNTNIIYRSDEEGNFDIFSIGSNGNNKIKLSDDEYFEESLSLSPDGTKVLYSSGQLDSTAFEVFVLDLNTLKTSQLTENMSYGRMPLWAEGGKKIVFNSDKEGYSEIFLMNIDGSAVKNLTNNDIEDSLINISPDGYGIFYQNFKEDGSSELMMYDLKNSNIVNIMKVEEVPSGTEDMVEEFETLKTGQSDSSEIFAFIDKNIESAGIEFADEIIDFVLQFSENELIPFGEKYSDPIMQQKLGTDFNGITDLEILRNATDKAISSLANETIARRYKLVMTEGYISPEIDYESYKSYGKFLSDQMNSFIEIMASESERPSNSDAAIVIPLNDFTDRIVKLYEFEEKYSGFIRIYYIVNMLNGKLWVYMGGIDNTPVFNLKNNTIIQERLDDFKLKAQKYKGTRFGDKLNEYLDLLKSQNYKKTQVIADYIDTLTFY